MAININIFNNANNVTRTVTFDFVGELMVAEDDTTVSPCNKYYFKITSGARKEDNSPYDLKIVRNLEELALNSQKQSSENVASAYGDIKTMIVDYVYDYVNGHTADQFDSGCTLQLPMKF